MPDKGEAQKVSLYRVWPVLYKARASFKTQMSLRPEKGGYAEAEGFVRDKAEEN